MPIPETAPTSDVRRVTELLTSSARPMTFAQLSKSLRLNDLELKAVLETAAGQSVIFRWPDYRKSQYFWSKSPEIVAAEGVMEAASTEALSRATLVARACRHVRGFSQKAMDRIVGNLVAGGKLQGVPAFTSGKLLIPAGNAAPYVAAARKFVEDKFRKTGLSPAGLFTSPAAAAPPPATTTDVPQQILDLVRSIEPITGVPVTTQRLRQRMPNLTKQEFDAAALELRKRQEVSLSLHHDPHNLPEADRDLLIDGRDGSYYVAIAIRR